MVGGDKRSQARPPGAPEACNGYPELCHKRLDQITFPATHNAMSAAAEPGWFLPNQRYGITRQLDDGIRALLIDTHYGIGQSGRGFGGVITDLSRENKTREEVTKELGAATVERAEDLVGRLRFGEEPHGDAEPYLCHVLCELGATKLDDALDGIDKWMNTHPDEFLIIVIEDVVSPEETAQAFQRSGLLRYVYDPTPGSRRPDARSADRAGQAAARNGRAGQRRRQVPLVSAGIRPRAGDARTRSRTSTRSPGRRAAGRTAAIPTTRSFR